MKPIEKQKDYISVQIIQLYYISIYILQIRIKVCELNNK